MKNTIKGFLPIAYNEFWDRVSYYGLQSLLVIYLTSVFGESYHLAYATYGAFAALSFGFGILGGIIADKLLGTWLSLVIGGICSMLGNAIIITHNLHALYIGAALVIIGVGVLKPSNSCALNKMFGGARLSKAFTYFYLFANAGSIIGPVVYGLGITFKHYSIGFIFCAIGMFSMLISLGVCVYLKKHIHDHKKPSTVLLALIILLIFAALIYLIVSNIISLKYFIVPALVALVLYLAKIYRSIEQNEKVKLISLIIPTLASILFFALLLQLYASIVVWLKMNINESIGGWAIPPTWFGTIEAMFVMVAPLALSRLWKALRFFKMDIHDNTKLIIGLLITAAAFGVFAISAILPSNTMVIIGVFIASFLLSLSEVSILPVSMALTTEQAPKKYKTTIMGLFYFTLTFSGYLSGEIASFSPTKTHSPEMYSLFFLKVAIFTITSAVVLYGLQKFCNRLTPTKS